jgi:phosphoribosylcarboxyaminoimidazole (NCAIR) mutase
MAAKILALTDSALAQRLQAYRQQRVAELKLADEEVQQL